MRILVIILLPVLLYPIIIIYFNKYEDILIRSEFAAIERQGLTLTKALALAEDQYGLIQNNQISSPVLQSLIPKVEYGSNIRAQLFNMYGDLIADTNVSMRYAPFVKISPLPSVDKKINFKKYFTNFVSLFSNLIARPLKLPLLKDNIIFSFNDFPEVLNALKGKNTKALRQDKNGKLFLSFALPIKNIRMVRGAVLLSVSGEKIEQELLDLETELFKAFGLILFATLSMGLYFGKSITTPIVKLANEADKIAEDKILKTVNLPEFELRKDEIGDLARSFFKMTKELQNRIDYIADFAADVAHELKNPITSMRSATETIVKIKDLEEQKKFIKVIQNDVQRIDRLINDISSASRLDAELSRIEMKKINIVDLLSTLIDIRSTTIECKINFFKEDSSFFIMGNDNRIAQVFDNLIQNAVSFSKNQGVINIRLTKNLDNIIILVEDYGPGFPIGALEKIFNRFYTERPSGEVFGNHSGLGLSISKQIIEAHNGNIEAFNRFDQKKKCLGATVKTILKVVNK
ncbi:HAMP domain-containing histidine kinase [Alphaproteobacteria bacterium]|nr:HAMP domain-containing histidine kinase [Alphaproteobacteria bacterium]